MYTYGAVIHIVFDCNLNAYIYWKITIRNDRLESMCKTEAVLTSIGPLIKVVPSVNASDHWPNLPLI